MSSPRKPPLKNSKDSKEPPAERFLRALSGDLSESPAASPAKSSGPAAPTPRWCAQAVRAAAHHDPPRKGVREPFSVRVDLGDGGGVVEQAFDPLFSDSSLVTVRYPVPLELPAEPSQGVLRVVDDCPGLLVGDVLRACSTFQLKPGTAFGLFASAVPARCLFLADGKTPDEVIKALTENTVERTSEVTMIFERPKQ